MDKQKLEFEPGSEVELLGQFKVFVVAAVSFVPLDRPELRAWAEDGRNLYAVAWIDARGRHARAIVHPCELKAIDKPADSDCAKPFCRPDVERAFKEEVEAWDL